MIKAKINKPKQLTTTSFDVQTINSELNEKTLLLASNNTQTSTSEKMAGTDCIDDINIENVNVELEFDCTNCLKCIIL